MRNPKGTPTLNRIMSRVVKNAETGCWLWTGGRSGDYAVINIDHRTHRVHRWLYEHRHGPIPEGMDLDHLCRVRACVNPDHVEPVTRQENLLRGQTIPARNAAKSHCPQGHAFTPENTYVTRLGGRICRACNALHHQKYRRSKRTG